MADWQDQACLSERLFIVRDEQIRQRLLSYLTKCPLPFQCKMGPVITKRTLEANARLWLLHTAASKITGYSRAEMHEFALCRHFGYTEHKCAGMILRVPLKRSSMRNKTEFREFMDETEAWYASDLGVWLNQQGE